MTINKFHKVVQNVTINIQAELFFERHWQESDLLKATWAQNYNSALKFSTSLLSPDFLGYKKYVSNLASCIL